MVGLSGQKHWRENVCFGLRLGRVCSHYWSAIVKVHVTATSPQLRVGNGGLRFSCYDYPTQCKTEHLSRCETVHLESTLTNTGTQPLEGRISFQERMIGCCWVTANWKLWAPSAMDSQSLLLWPPHAHSLPLFICRLQDAMLRHPWQLSASCSGLGSRAQCLFHLVWGKTTKLSPNTVENNIFAKLSTKSARDSINWIRSSWHNWLSGFLILALPHQGPLSNRYSEFSSSIN